MFVYSVNEMTSAAKGKVVVAFTTESEEMQLDYITKLSTVHARGLIFATKRIDDIKVSEVIPIITVDYEHGSTIFKYIRSTR